MTSLNRVTSSRLWQRAHLAKQNVSRCIFFHQVVQKYDEMVELDSQSWRVPESDLHRRLWEMTGPDPSASARFDT